MPFSVDIFPDPTSQPTTLTSSLPRARLAMLASRSTLPSGGAISFPSPDESDPLVVDRDKRRSRSGSLGSGFSGKLGLDALAAEEGFGGFEGSSVRLGA